MKLWNLSFSLLLMLSTAALGEEIRIGVSLPLSGEAAVYGDDARRALEFAEKRFGNPQVKIVREDDLCSGRGAVSAAHKLANVEKVKVVIGPICSGSLLSAAPVYERAKVIAFGIATSAPAISQAGRYIFRLSPSDADTAKVLAGHIKKQSHEEGVGIFTELTDYCEGIRAELLRHLTGEKITVVEESFQTGDTDLRSALARMRSKQVSALFVNTQSERTFVVVMDQLAQLNWRPQIYGAYWPSSAYVREKLGSKAEGIRFVDMPTTSEYLTPEGQKLVKEFEAEFGPSLSLPLVVPLTIEAFRLAVMVSGKADPVSFLETGTFEGPWGSYRFDADGDLADIPVTLKEIKNGDLHTLEIVKP